MRTFLIVTSVILTLVVVRYFAPARVPGPMVHPWRYKIISSMFSMIIDLVSALSPIYSRCIVSLSLQSHCIQWVTGVPYYQVLNRIVDSYDPVKKRDFDRGQVTVSDITASSVVTDDERGIL
jgi:hypothetical protein